MDRRIDGSIEQRLFNLLGEQAFAADFRQRNINDLVACRFDNVDASLDAHGLEPRSNVASLPQSELGTARADCQHYPSPNRNNRRITLTKWIPLGSAACFRNSVIGPCAILFTIPRAIAWTASSCCGV